MPNQYQRKTVAGRGNWSEESLKAAIQALKNREMSVYAAAKVFKIPRKTLERRFKTDNDKKGPMGPSSFFGEENEKKIADHIKNMQSKGFPLTIGDGRSIGYNLAVKLNLKHKFNTEKEKAGYDWLNGFLKRNPDITLRKSEGVSLARARGMNKAEVAEYFKILEDSMTVENVMLEPKCIFNMDETGLQLNNRPGHVLAKKGSKAVSTITSTEKGETITVIACCNAEGIFLPPVAIMKGKNKKPEFEDGMPPGSKVMMSQKSAYITTALFLEWLKTHFVPRKPHGKVLLLLDGHSTHCNSVEMLEYAVENDIILVSMPSHTSHYLQPLDRSVFKSLKTHFYEQVRIWLKQNVGRQVTRLTFGKLLNSAWGKSASAENAIAGFRATGVYPFNPSAIPDYAFVHEERSEIEAQSQNTTQITRNNATISSANEQQQILDHGQENDCNADVVNSDSVVDNGFSISIATTSKGTPEKRKNNATTFDVRSQSEQNRISSTSPEMIPKKRPKVTTPAELPSLSMNKSDLTPTQILKDLSPVPEKLLEVRKRAKQVGKLLTSVEHINIRKTKEEAQVLKEQKKIKKEECEKNINIKEENKTKSVKKTDKTNKTKMTEKPKKKLPIKRKSMKNISESSNDEEEDIILNDSSEEDDSKEEDNCVGCGENYYQTQLIEDWIQCAICLLWVHENCTEFDNICSKCGQHKKKRDGTW